MEFSAAAERNKEPILAVLRRVLPAYGTVLEIASGTGQHVIHFAAALPDLAWQPSDVGAKALASIAARLAASGAANIRQPLRLDVTGTEWPDARYDALLCSNMIHIAPWAACLGLIAGAARVLAPGGLLLLYGPFLVDGVPTAPGNLAFDADLRARDPRWGLRRLEDIAAAAAPAGFTLRERVPMPANNQILVFGHSPCEPVKLPGHPPPPG